MLSQRADCEGGSRGVVQKYSIYSYLHIVSKTATIILASLFHFLWKFFDIFFQIYCCNVSVVITEKDILYIADNRDDRFYSN
jgi:hypothetical protein